MEVVVRTSPCMMLEAVELLYAYVNNLPPSALTGSGPYCIPASSIQTMLHQACDGVDPEDPLIQFFFAASPLRDDSGKLTCIARNMAYCAMDLTQNSAESYAKSVQKTYAEMRTRQNRIVSIGEHTLEFRSSGEDGFLPLTPDVEKLPVSPLYRQKLVEVFSAFPTYMEQLTKVVLPVIRILEPMLTPWVENAAQLAVDWQNFFAQPDMMEALQKRWLQGTGTTAQGIYLTFRYLQAMKACGQIDEDTRIVSFHMGVGRPFLLRKDRFEAWEYRALRLLGSPARMKMLSALVEKSMTSREMAQQLELHLGAVGRDVSSLFDARLLTVETSGGRGHYRTNLDALDTIIRHLSDIRNSGTEQ